MDGMSHDDLTAFAAGAYGAAREAGMGDADASALAGAVVKSAARRVRYDDDDDDGTWWSRNKGWLLPALVGTCAFLVGADAGRNGRPDRGHWSNADSLAMERLRKLLGVDTSQFWRSFTHADRTPPKPVETPDAFASYPKGDA